MILRSWTTLSAGHLAVRLGLKPIKRGYRVPFTTAAGLIAALTRAR